MPKIVDHEKRRAELLEASLALVAEEGIEAATMRRLASAAACTTGAVTYYFDGRDALLIAMLRHAHARAALRMAEAAGNEHDPLQRLWAILLEALPLDDERVSEWRVWLAFWGTAAGRADLRREHEARYKEWRALLSSAVRVLIADAAQARLFVDSVQSIVDGYGVQIALCGSGDAARMRALRRSLFAVLRHQFEAAGLSGLQPS